MDLFQSYRLLASEEARRCRRDELHTLITEYIMAHLPDTAGREMKNEERPAEMLVDALPRINEIDDVEALEVFLEFLPSIPVVNYFDFHNFISLSGVKDNRGTISGVFLYRVYLGMEGFVPDYDARDGVVGLGAYSHLDELLLGDDAVQVSSSLIEAARTLGGRTSTTSLVHSKMFPCSTRGEQVGYFLEDYDLATMIALNPERTGEIVDVVAARGSFPGAEATWEIIESDAKALSAGVI